MKAVSKKGISLKAAVTCAILAIVVLMGLLMTIFSYAVKQQLIVTGYGEQTIRIAQTVASTIDPERFTLTIEKGEADEYWHEVKSLLDRIINETGVMFIYTLLPGYEDEMITYFATGDIIGNEFPVDFLHQDSTEWYPLELFSAMDTGIAANSDIYDADEFGILIGGFAPIFDNEGGIVGLVCVEICVSEVVASVNASMLIMSLFAIGIVIVCFVLSMIVANKALIKPVNEMTETMSKVCDGDFNFQFPKSSIREISTLTESFSDMIHMLSTVIEEIQKRNQEIIEGHLTKNIDGFTAKGDFQKILDGVNVTAENAAKYLDEVACGVILFDTDYNITFVNAYNRNFGYTDLMDKKLSDALIGGVGDLMVEKLNETSRTGEPVSYPVEIKTPDGSSAHLNHTMVALKDNTGKAVAFMNVSYDLTEIVNAKAELAERLHIINESIKYAGKIQKNLIPDEDKLKEAFSDYSIIWKPRDVVGGDIYWAKNFDDGTILCVCDCTGHGTPGALLTMLVVSSFESTITNERHTDTAEIIYMLDRKLSSVLNVKSGDEFSTDINDGCDLAVLFIAKDGSITMSAGNMGVFVCNGEKVTRYKGQKMYVGEGKIKSKDKIKTVKIPADPGNKFYIASDGLYDQIGGEEKIPYGYSGFEGIILDNHNEKHSVISDKIWQSFEEYRGDNMRRDDFELITFTPKLEKEANDNV